MPNIDTSMESILEDAYSGQSGTGEEELLRIAAKYSVQVSARQMRTLLICQMIANKYTHNNNAQMLANMGKIWLDYKQYHNSMPYVMRSLDSISLRRFMNENSVKVNVQKQ